jgi:hypothetical protein
VGNGLVRYDEGAADAENGRLPALNADLPVVDAAPGLTASSLLEKWCLASASSF